jgi:hypothetical protein
MRFAPIAASFAVLVFATAASAQTIETISYSPEFQEALDEDYGAREGEYLNRTLTRYVGEALAERGVNAEALRIEVDIVDAQPNRPTMEQVASTPGLDMLRSRSIGGAELHGVVRDASGAVIAEIDHRYYSHDLEDASYALDTWGDARRSIRRFANKLADAAAGAS